MESTNLTIRIDKDLKAKAEELFSDLGLSLSAAFNIFIKQALREQGIPFTISRDIPNNETLQAIKEVQRLKGDPNKKVYSNFSESLEEIETGGLQNE